MKKILKTPHIVIAFLLGLVVVQAIRTILHLTSIPTDVENIFMFGLSTARLVMVGVALIWGSIAGLGAFYAFKHPATMADFIEKPFFQKYNSWVTLPVFILFTALSWASFVDLSLHETYINNIQTSYYQRIYPIALLLVVTLFCYLLFTIYVNLRQLKSTETDSASIGFWALISLLILLALWGLVLLTGWGITPQNAFWGEAGAVLLGYQTLLVILASTILAVILAPFYKYVKLNIIIDIVLILALWWVAKEVWINTDLAHNFFFPMTSQTNPTRYPYSDAASYDVRAQKVLDGVAFQQGAYSTRSTYVFFLATAHWLIGYDYLSLINVQIAMLALSIPILYLIGKTLHSRNAGLMMSGLYVLIELTLIEAAPYIKVTNSKLLLTEFPTGMLLMAFTYFTVMFFQKLAQDKTIIPLSFYVSSGLLGVTALTRLHSLPILFAILGLLLVVYKINFKAWWKPAAIYSLVFFAVVSPWMMRNLIISGDFSLAPGKFNSLSEQRWESEEDPEETIASQETEVQPSALTLIPAHFVHNEILSILSLPLSYPYQTTGGYYENSFAFDTEWAGELSSEQITLVIVNLIIISIGLGSAFARHKFAGVVPLIIQATYYMSNALSRTSGWRYLRPADWVLILYFALGIAEIIRFVFPQLMTTTKVLLELKEPRKHKWMVSGVFIALTLTTSFAPAFMPKRHAPLTSETFKENLPEEVWQAYSVELEAYLTLPNTHISSGTLMYPRFQLADQHIYHIKTHPFNTLDINRIEFTLVNDLRVDFMIATETDLEFFPHGSDAIILSCEQGQYQEIYFIYVFNDEGDASYFGDIDDLENCH